MHSIILALALLVATPMDEAAEGYRDDLIRSYAENYAAAAVSLDSGVSFRDTQSQLQESMRLSARRSFSRRFAPWASALPPEGFEPSTEAQRATIRDIMAACAGAFK